MSRISSISRALVLSALLPLAAAAQSQTAVFSGGCFWGVDAVFKHVKGVTRVVSGYSGGEAATAHYDIVSEGTTGHAESVQVTFDPSKVTYQTLLKVFFSVAHDPTELNYQGPDQGTQYRSAIWYANADQQKAAQAAIAELTRQKAYKHPIVTQVVPLKKFYPAEDYHQNYLAQHLTQPYIVYNDIPKVENLKAKYPALYRP
ncbi:MAG: peptide-methionine (S)-S-oxide reductase MsrA [Gemmatimonadaceae bacterium]